MKSKKYDASFIDSNVKRWLDEMRSDDSNCSIVETDRTYAGNTEGFCIKRFNADFVVYNLQNQLEIGKEITAQGNTYIIAKVGKRCFNECEYRNRNGKACTLADGVAFGNKKG